MTATVTGSGISGNPVTFADTGVAAQLHHQIQYYGPTPSPRATGRVRPPRSPSGSPSSTATSVRRSSVTDAAGRSAAPESRPINQTVTDLLILAKFDSIDGPGQILGQAGPCFIRMSNGLTVVGRHGLRFGRRRHA